MIAFDIPAAAAMAIKIDQAESIAKLTDITDTRLAFHLEGKVCHVSCSTEIALCLVEALRYKAVIGDAPSQPLFECSNAIMEIFDAIEWEIQTVRN